MSTDVSVIDGDVVPLIDSMSWEDLLLAGDTTGMFVVPGGAKVTKESIARIPHIVTGVTFQTPQQFGPGETPRDYATVEATIANEETLTRYLPRIYGGVLPAGAGIEVLSVEPGERVFYNDGGTGIRRQLVQLFLDASGIITVGTPKTMPVDCKNRFDLPWTMWENAGDQWKTYGSGEDERRVPYITRNHLGGPFLVKALRGIYESDPYDTEYVKDATTWYYR